MVCAELDKLKSQLATALADNADLSEGIDGMIQDREYFEELAKRERLCIGCQKEWRDQIAESERRGKG